MARVAHGGEGARRTSARGAATSLGRRLANCSLKTAFALYAGVGLLIALILSFISTGLLGLLAESTLGNDPYAYSGIFVYDGDANALVPAEALSWYEIPATEQIADDAGANGTDADAVVFYVESLASADKKAIPLDDPPQEAADIPVTDIAWTYEDASGERSLPFSEIAAYDGEASAARPGAAEAAALAEALPSNADGERPVVSNVGYYLPYPGDPEPYRAIANIAIASVPVIFVACLAVTGRRFFRDRLERPIEVMDGAARRIASDDLDFAIGPQRSDELGRLCTQFEAMRAELADSMRALWRTAENRRRVNAAFAHDLRTPLTVIRGQAEMLERLARDDATRASARAIGRQAARLGRYAESMTGVDALEATEPSPVPVDPSAWFASVTEDARAVAGERGIGLASRSPALPALVSADAQMLSRVADNLVSNAVRHASGSIGLSLDWHGGRLALVVEDDGEGFSDGALEHASEPFWRGGREGVDNGAAAPERQSESHMGLGLYICSLLSEKHGGCLEIANRPQGGALVRAVFAAPVCKTP